MKKALNWMRIAAAVLTVLLAALLCWRCVSIYLAGAEPLFTREAAAQALAPLRPLLALDAAAVLAALVLQAVVGEKQPRVRPQRPVRQPDQPRRAAYVLLFGTAVLFIVLGVMNGGLRDVLYKAIQICTECIGLG